MLPSAEAALLSSFDVDRLIGWPSIPGPILFELLVPPFISRRVRYVDGGGILMGAGDRGRGLGLLRFALRAIGEGHGLVTRVRLVERGLGRGLELATRVRLVERDVVRGLDPATRVLPGRELELVTLVRSVEGDLTRWMFLLVTGGRDRLVDRPLPVEVSELGLV